MMQELNLNPIQIFEQWLTQAKAISLVDPMIMALATANTASKPSVRMVLLKSFDEDGFVFYTNITSRKGRELTANPHASLCFYWPAIGRQVRVEGNIERVDDKDSDEYYASRPHARQVMAWASKQSQPMATFTELAVSFDQAESQFSDQPIKRPDWWLGFRVKPQYIEFWQEKKNLQHQRFCYDKTANGWQHNYLYP